jgi:cytidine deaminase
MKSCALLDGVVQQFSAKTPHVSEQSPPESSHKHDSLIQAASEARLRAYAPYSNFSVGAAVLTSTGKVFSGCNIENSTYGATRCAEQVALCQAYAHGERDITAIAVVTDTSPPSPPCGICRQVICELAGKAEIVLANLSGETKCFRIDDLLPEAFHQGFLS